MHAYKIRLNSGLKSVALWWFLSAYVSCVLGAIFLGKEAAILNIVATSVFSVFLAIGVFIGAKNSDENEKINLKSTKMEPVEKLNQIDPCCTSPGPVALKPYSAYIQSRDKHGTIVLMAKSKEEAKRKIIERFPDCKMIHFDEWSRENNYIINGKLDD